MSDPIDEAEAHLPVRLTKAAKEVLDEASRAHNMWGWGVRIALAPKAKDGGFDLRFEEAASRMDMTIGSRGMKLFVDVDVLAQIEGTVIDHDGRQFTFRR